MCVCVQKMKKKCEMNKEKWPSRISVCVCVCVFVQIEHCFFSFDHFLFSKAYCIEKNQIIKKKLEIENYSLWPMCINNNNITQESLLLLFRCCCLSSIGMIRILFAEMNPLLLLVLVLDFYFSSIDSISQLSSSSSCLTTM